MEEINEQERLENEANLLRQRLKKLLTKQALGQLKDESIIKETKEALFKIQTSIELNNLANKKTK